MSTVAALLLGLAVGLPLTLLAAVIAYHARVLARGAAPRRDAWLAAAAELGDPQYDDPQYDDSRYEAEYAPPQYAGERVAPAPSAPRTRTHDPFSDRLRAAQDEPFADPALDRLEQTVSELQAQLARQGGALGELLSEPPDAPFRAAPSEPLAAPRAAAPLAEPERPAAPAPRATARTTTPVARTAAWPSPAQPAATPPTPGRPPAGQPAAGQPTAGQPAAGQSTAGQSTADLPLRDRVDTLAAEGLSERAIARRLRIGLEEVRLLRLPEERAS